MKKRLRLKLWHTNKNNLGTFLSIKSNQFPNKTKNF